MNRRFALAAVLAVVGAALLVLAPTADAVTVADSGWWSRLATTTPTDELPAALPVPAPTAPDTVPAAAPEGVLVVEGAPDGATAIAAARWELGDGESSPSLVLPVGEGSTLNPQSIVLACRAATPWTKPDPEPGMWDSKPLVDGSRCINGVIADDLSSVAFGVQPLVSGNTLDVVLVPGKEAEIERPAGVPEPPADIDGSVFRWMFDPPSADSVEVVAGSDFSAGEGDRVVTPQTSPAPDLGAVGPPPTEPSQSGAPDASPAFEAPEQAVSPALPEEALADSPPEVSNLVPAAASDPANRTIGWILLALSALLAAWAHLTSGGAQAAAGDGVVGGLSRFARPRATPPTPLS